MKYKSNDGSVVIEDVSKFDDFVNDVIKKTIGFRFNVGYQGEIGKDFIKLDYDYRFKNNLDADVMGEIIVNLNKSIKNEYNLSSKIDFDVNHMYLTLKLEDDDDSQFEDDFEDTNEEYHYQKFEVNDIVIYNTRNYTAKVREELNNKIGEIIEFQRPCNYLIKFTKEINKLIIDNEGYIFTNNCWWCVDTELKLANIDPDDDSQFEEDFDEN